MTSLLAEDAVRRQLERDLHDGAQQRFVLASLWLRRAADQVEGTPAEALVARTYEELQLGLAELRDLAHGIHPPALSDRGLSAALDGLARRSPLAMQLMVTPERFVPAVESAIYFTVAEALTNVARHAQATQATVAVEVAGDTLMAAIDDDGIGGARPSAGSGLRGLADRLGALGGALSIESPPGGPTSITARVPT